MSSDIIWYAFLFLCAASINLLVHEIGHYVAARLTGVDVVWWQFGVGPTVLRFSNRKNTEFRICLFPFIWTFPQFLDKAHTGTAEQGLTNRYEDLRLHGRLFLIFAGSGANFILSFLLLASFQFFNVPQKAPVIDVTDQSIAYQSGLRSGDRIATIDGDNVAHWQDIGLSLVDRFGDTGRIDIGVQRDGTLHEVQVLIDDWHAADFRVFILDDLGISPASGSDIETVRSDASLIVRTWHAVVEWFVLLLSTIILFLKMLLGEYSLMNAFGAMQMAQLGLGLEGLNWLALVKIWGLVAMAQALSSFAPGAADGNAYALIGAEFVTGTELSGSTTRSVLIGAALAGAAPLIVVLIHEGIRLFN